MKTMEWHAGEAATCLATVNRWLAQHAGDIKIEEFFAKPMALGAKGMPAHDIESCKVAFAANKSGVCYRITLADEGVFDAGADWARPMMVLAHHGSASNCEVRLWEIPLDEVG